MPILPTAASESTIPTPEVVAPQQRADRIQPGTTVDEMQTHVRDAMELLDMLDKQDPAIATISDAVQAKLATISTIAAPENEDETKIIDALFLGIMSVKKLLELKGVTTQYDDQITTWETALNNPNFKRDHATILQLKDILRGIQEKI